MPAQQCVNCRHLCNDRLEKRTKWLACLLGLTWWAAAPLGAAEPVTAALDRNIISLGEEATLTISFENSRPITLPQLPALTNVVVGNRSEQASTRFANGQGSTRHHFLFPLRPTRDGRVIIPALSFELGGQTFATPPLTLTVTEASSTLDPGTGQLRLFVPKTSVYFGEALPIEIALYIQAGRNATSPQLVRDGFTIGSMEQQPIQRATLGNVIYNLVPFRSFVVAAKSGALTMGPASLTLDVPAPNARRNIRGQVLDWQRRTLRSDSFALEVKPLPSEDVPATFNGAVGSYSLTATAGPTNLSVGDPITVRIRLTGQGHLDSLTWPDQPAWASFQSYPASSSVSSTDPHHLNGHKDFELVVVPLAEEVPVLPPVQFSYFDVETAAYRTLTGPSIALQVVSAEHTARNVPALASGAPEPDDILHIRSRLEESRPGLLLRQGWFLSLQAVPVFVWAGLHWRRRRRQAWLNNPRLQRQRDVSWRVRQGLAELRRQAARGAADQFFATLFRLLQEQLGERLDLPASAITESVIDERLRRSGLAENDLRVLHQLFEACNQVRYAPSAFGPQMDQLIGQTETVLRRLQALRL